MCGSRGAFCCSFVPCSRCLCRHLTLPLPCAEEWLCWPCRKYEEEQLAQGVPAAQIRPPRWQQEVAAAGGEGAQRLPVRGAARGLWCLYHRRSASRLCCIGAHRALSQRMPHCVPQQAQRAWARKHGGRLRACSSALAPIQTHCAGAGRVERHDVRAVPHQGRGAAADCGRQELGAPGGWNSTASCRATAELQGRLWQGRQAGDALCGLSPDACLPAPCTLEASRSGEASELQGGPAWGPFCRPAPACPLPPGGRALAPGNLPHRRPRLCCGESAHSAAAELRALWRLLPAVSCPRGPSQKRAAVQRAHA